MRSTTSIRTATVAALAFALVATTGCSWFRNKNNAFAQPAETRPLEVPPDLDRPGSAVAAAPASVSRSEVGAPATAGLGFAVPGARDATYQRVGQALDATAGVTIASRAELLGTFDVSYEGSSFLVRVVQQNENSSYVSAVDARGVAPEGPAAAKLMQQLQAQLGGG
ncbi:MAG: hypothetical protein Q4F49_06005 [Pseudoxanthomonas suwonensis]|nr:hypothetical protein [Pseudoxanthomonas suwonensis]